VDSNLEHTTAD